MADYLKMRTGYILTAHPHNGRQLSIRRFGGGCDFVVIVVVVIIGVLAGRCFPTSPRKLAGDGCPRLLAAVPAR